MSATFRLTILTAASLALAACSSARLAIVAPPAVPPLAAVRLPVTVPEFSLARHAGPPAPVAGAPSALAAVAPAHVEPSVPGTAAYILRPALQAPEHPIQSDLALLPASSSMAIGNVVAAPMGFVYFCATNAQSCIPAARKAPVALTVASYEALNSVNRQVNDAIWPAADRSADGDVWSVAPQYGDCDDYAVTKRERLMRAGWPADSLLLATARIRGGERHAVLVVVTDRGDFVLDNLTSEIAPWSETGYSWETRQTRENPLVWQAVGSAKAQFASLN